MRTIMVLVILMLLPAAMTVAQSKLSGYMFGDYYYNIARDATGAPANAASSGAAPGSTAMQAFQFRRIYFTYDNDISQKFASRFRLEADQAALTSNAKIGTYVKDAYLRWKNVFGASDLFFGIQPTPSFDASEAAWGYRSVEKTIMDLRGIVASRDLGLSLKGKLTDNGMFNYWLMVANGAGTGNVENDKYKRYYALIQVKPVQNLQATVSVDFAARADFLDPYQSGVRVGNGMTTMSGFVGYSEGKLNAGAEGFLQSTANGYDNGTALASKNAVGLSLFGSYNLEADMAIVGRYDYYDPNTDTNVRAYGDIRNYIIAGFAWKPDPNVSVIPNILYETYESAINGTSFASSITARITLYYVFI